MLGSSHYKPLSNDVLPVNHGPVSSAVSGAALKQENAHALAHNNKFRTFFKEKGFQEAAEATGVVSKSPSTDKVTFVSSFSDRIGSTPGTTNHNLTTSMSKSHNVSTFIGLNQSNTSSINPPLLLPKSNGNSQQKYVHVAAATSTKNNQSFTPNISISSSSPLYSSTSHPWQGGSLLLNRKRIRAEYDDNKRVKATQCGTEKGLPPVPPGLRVCGLRHFSMKVCEKVQQKGITSYNEVADELVHEFSEQTLKNPLRELPNSDQSYDQKNIRRRVYDALNVLMAMNIISKEKKEIKWVGLPTNSAHECRHLENQKSERIKRIEQKQQQLKELIIQQIVYKNLVQRNKKEEKKRGTPPANTRIHLPFLIVNTGVKTVVDCSISNDKSEYIFNFDESFEIHDDMEVLKRMGLSFGLEKGVVSEKDLKSARTMVPKALQHYVLQMCNGTYGDLNLIDFGKAVRKSKSPQIPSYISSLPSPGPSHQLSSLKRMIQSSLIPQVSESSQVYSLLQPAESCNDTDDADIENTSALI